MSGVAADEGQVFYGVEVSLNLFSFVIQRYSSVAYITRLIALWLALLLMCAQNKISSTWLQNASFDCGTSG